MLSKENTGKQMAGNQSNREGTLLPNSQQILKLPEGFEVKEAIDGGDCFFDSVAQGLKQLKPDMEFTIKSLRQICKNLALSDQQLKKQIVADAKSFHDPTIIPSCHTINDDELWNAYLAGIEYTAEDMKGMETQEPHLYKALTNLKYGSTLQVPMWGRPNIEGKMICSKYNVKLHIIENLPNSGYSHQLINELTSRSIDCVDYDEENTIHIINKGASHFEPILRKQTLSHGHNIMISSEENPDSKSVHLQQNSQNDAADNQIDYQTDVEVLPAESTVVDYEDRLSGDISDGTWHSALDDAASDEVMKKATFFVETFVKKFEKKVFEYSEEVKPDSKTRKPGKMLTHVNSIVNNAIPPSILRLSICKTSEVIDLFAAKKHRKGAKKVSAACMPLGDQLREVLVEASLEIFQKFEKQLTGIVDADSSFWKRGVEKLAIDAASRAINYILASNEKGELPVSRITKGVVLGKSKSDTLAKQYLCKSAKSLDSEVFQPGFRVQDKQSGEILLTSALYENVGIKKIEGNATKYYQLNEHEKYGYRLPFTWELEEWWKVSKKYMPADPPKEEYVYILDEEKKKKLVSNILKEINGNDPVRKKDIEKLNEKIEKLHVYSENKDKNIFSFNFGHLPEFFIKREEVLNELEKKLSSKNQEVEMSRMILIHGKYGTGKSELARSYAHSKESDGSNIWTKVVWINAETYDTLSSSFCDLAKKLKISMENVVDHRDREIESVIKDVYENFRDVKSLVIFDNASEYKEVEKFLPSNFSDLFFGGEKPYVLITSRSENWEERIEKMELDEGFLLHEAVKFIEKYLGIDGRLYDEDLIKLAKVLKYLPLALKQAVAHIKQEKLSISEYLERYNEAVQKSNFDFFVAQGIPKELFTTLKVTFDQIRGEKHVGKQSHNFLTYMAYLSPDQIDTAEIFLRKKSEKDKQQVLDIFDLLNKFSVIELEESTAKVHRGIQKTIRVEEELAGTEEETLRGIMTSFCLTNVNHITSIWSHVSKYSKLVNDFIDSVYDEGSTILHLLAKDGNKEVIRLILEKIDLNKLSEIINAVDEEDLTALDYAAMYGHLEIVKYFIEKGSRLYDNNDELTPLNWAAICGQLEIVKFFIDNEFYQSSEESNVPLYYAVKHGHLSIVEYFVEKGDSVNIQDLDAMHWAAENGHLDIVKYLVEKVANINLQDLDGMSPMHWAAKNGHLGIVKYLVEKGSSIDLQDEDGMSPMHWTAKGGHLDIIKYLVEKGGSIDLQDEDGMSPMHWTAKGGHLDIIKYLVEKGGSMDLQDDNGMSPVYYAIFNGHLDIAEYLFKQGTKMNLKDNYNNTPLDYAVIVGNLDIAEHLLELRAKMSQKSKDFLYIYANFNGYSNIMRLLKEQYLASDLKTQSHKKRQKVFDEHTLPKKGKLENMREENASNIQLFQGSQNPPSDISMQFEGFLGGMVSGINRIPMSSFNSIAVEPINNKSLQGG